MAVPVPSIHPINNWPTNLNDTSQQAQNRHDRYAMKLREAEIEERNAKESISQKSLDKTMSEIFAAWER